MPLVIELLLLTSTFTTTEAFKSLLKPMPMIPHIPYRDGQNSNYPVAILKDTRYHRGAMMVQSDVVNSSSTEIFFNDERGGCDGGVEWWRRWIGRCEGKQKRVRRSKRTMLGNIFLWGIMATLPTAASSAASTITPSPSPPFSPRILGISNLSIAASFLLSLITVLHLLGIRTLSRKLLLAAGRCTLQLSILGALILDRLFTNNEWYIILPWLGFITLIAANEVRNVRYTYPSFPSHIRMSFFAGLTIGITALTAIVRPKPWWDARYLIPIGGMLLGNTLTTVTLGSDALLSELAEGRDRVELRLARGATALQAARPAIRLSLEAGMTNICNSMSVTGLVNLPGMMSGQILGGQGPTNAAAYQILILFLIATVACSTLLMTSWFIVVSLFDLRGHVLNCEGLVLKRREDDGAKGRGVDLAQAFELLWENVSNCFRRKRNRFQGDIETSAQLLGNYDQIKRYNGNGTEKNMELINSEIKQNESSSTIAPILPPSLTSDESTTSDESFPEPTSRQHAQTIIHQPIPLHPSSNETSITTPPSTPPIILTAENLTVRRTGLTVSFTLRKGDRLAITGRSGVGKTQLLKTIARLVPSSYGTLHLPHKVTINTTTPYPPHWRQHVTYISQDRPTIPGTPRQFYDDCRSYHHHHHHPSIYDIDPSSHENDLDNYASRWNLPPNSLDKSWGSLSGGEAQRASLAVALTNARDVLLLDEPTSACDEVTAKEMERTLREWGGCVVLVTHSRAQVERFCNLELTLD